MRRIRAAAFFSADYPELLIKVINGCGSNNRHRVFASAGTNVGLQITVVDTKTGTVRSYSNPIGRRWRRSRTRRQFRTASLYLALRGAHLQAPRSEATSNET
jgi:hypothetical protein